MNKMKVDYSSTVKEKVPECEKLAKNGKLDEALVTLLSLEEQARTGGDTNSLSKVLVTIAKLCCEKKDFKLSDQIEQLILKMIQECFTYVDLIQDQKTKHDFIITLREVTAEKINFEVERAHLTYKLACLEADRSKLLKELEIDVQNLLIKYGKKECYEKLSLLLGQIRFSLANQPLPFLVLEIIFRELSINDLLTCRLVNGLFKYLSDHTNDINKLIIGQPNYDYDNNYWCHNNKLINDKDIISLKSFRIIQKSSLFNLDKNLKYLKINDKQLKLEEISNLINLESIEFGKEYEYKNEQVLNLNKLKVFVFNHCDVRLNTPNLEKIQFNDINHIKSNFNPELIKHLITKNYSNRLEIFKNLEIMELRRINQYAMNENLLTSFEKLKQLKINFYCDAVNYSDEFINSLKNFAKKKTEKSIDFYLEGIKIENIENIESYKLVLIEDSIWRSRLNNYVSLYLPTINYLKYEELEECVNNIKNDLPSLFFNKFIYINYVKVDSVKDIDGLSWFLKNLKCLNNLEIEESVSLNEVLYNNLPDTIRKLTIYDRSNINCDFILKLSNLAEFVTNVDKDLFNLAYTSFLNLKYLNRFQFIYDANEIRIIKKGEIYYFNDLHSQKELNYKQLIEECDKLR